MTQQDELKYPIKLTEEIIENLLGFQKQTHKILFKYNEEATYEGPYFKSITYEDNSVIDMQCAFDKNGFAWFMLVDQNSLMDAYFIKARYLEELQASYYILIKKEFPIHKTAK